MSKGADGTQGSARNPHTPVLSEHSPDVALLLGLDEFAPKPGSVSRALSLVHKPHFLPSARLDRLYLREELLNFLNKVHHV